MTDRENYKSDYDVMRDMYSNVKTDNYGNQSNALANNTGDWHDNHEHAWYDPSTGRCGWHGSECNTKHNGR